MASLPPIKGFLETTLLDWRGKVASVLFLPGCNFRCPYCHNHLLVLNPGELETIPFERVMSRLRQLRQWNDGVVISGGEPTLQPGLPGLLTRLRQDGWLLKLDTNGSRPEVVAGLLELGLLDAVSMDIKAPLDDAAYRRNAGVSVDLDAVRTSIGVLAGVSHKLDIEFRTTLTPGFLLEEDILAIEAMVKSRAPGARYTLQAFNPENPLNPKLCDYPAAEPLERKPPQKPDFLQP
ncbi:MAG: anaerobic ribonucleoside-triphosphate reductase activating protein [Deltaproteobacteria bacterium]|nr:anaerobic ribonucleoside-triphosphate reductase activating protein [Deltaproteobacteria bacterium]